MFLGYVGIGRNFYDVKPCSTFYIEVLNPQFATERPKRSL